MRSSLDSLKQHGLLVQIMHYTLTIVFIRGVQVLLTPIVTRLLSPEEYGLSTVFLQTVNLVGAVAIWGLNASLTQVYLREREAFPDTLKSILLFVLIMAVVCAPLLPWVAQRLAAAFELPVTLLYLAIPMGIALGFSILHNALMTADKRSLTVTRLSILNVTGAGLLFLVFLWWGDRTWMARAYSYSIIVALLLVLALREFLPRVRAARFSRDRLRYALGYGLPTVFSGISFTLFIYADRVLLTRYRSAEEMGLYSFVCVIGLLPLMISGAVLMAFTPHLYRHLNEGNPARVKFLSHRLTLAVAVGCLAVALLARPLASLLAEPQYHASLDAVPILILFAFAFYTMSYSANYLLYHEATGTLSLAWGVALVVNLTLNVLFIPQYGYIAAAWSTLIAGALHACIVVALVRLRHGVRTTGALLNLAILGLGGVALVWLQRTS